MSEPPSLDRAVLDRAVLGRSVQCARLDAVVAAGGAAVVVGMPGVGKSTLLRHAEHTARGRGATVLRAVGVEAEAALPFGALHQLLHPVLARVADLPPVQRTALHGAFGLEETPPVSGLRLGTAVLALLTVLAADAPVLVVLDDAHWADADSLGVLGFVVRRLGSAQLAVLVARRHGAVLPLEGAAELPLGPLDDAAAQRLLDTRWPRLAPATRRRVLQTAGGNPLGLVELPAALAHDGVAPTGPPGASLPLTERLERAFAHQTDRLPPATATVLLAAALNSGAAVFEALQAASVVVGRPVLLDDVLPAVTAGLIGVHASRIGFTHPLIRSAVVGHAGLAARQAVHTALAELLVRHPDRRVWHRAALVSADDGVADDLDAVSRRALARGALSAARQALVRAAELTVDRRARESRLVRAAELAAEMGDRTTGIRLLEQIQGPPTAAVVSIRLLLEQRWFAAEWSGTDGLAALLAAADDAAAGGWSDIALKALLPLIDSPDADVREAVIEKVATLSVAEDDPDHLRALGFGDLRRTGRHIRDSVRRALDAPMEPMQARAYATAATVVGDFETAVAVLPGVVWRLREQDRLGGAAQALVSLSWSHLHTGDLRRAGEVAASAEELCLASAQPYWHAAAVAALLWLEAGRLDGPAFDAAFRAGLDRVDADLVSPHAASMFQRACALSSLSRARYREAYDLLAADFSRGPGWRWWAFAELAQAGAHAGRTAEIAELAALLDGLADATGSPLLLRYRAFVAPLVAAEPEQEELFRVGITALDGDPHLRARLAHEFGGWLRRRRRVRESRVVLHVAREAFARDGLAGWVEQVETELRATGEGPGQDPVLTPQEAAVARLVATGLSNREVAEVLRISHRTVSTHLHRIFRKLGIEHRAELAAVVG